MIWSILGDSIYMYWVPIFVLGAKVGKSASLSGAIRYRKEMDGWWASSFLWLFHALYCAVL